MPKNIFSFFTKQTVAADVSKTLSSELLFFWEQLPCALLLADKDGCLALANPVAAKLLDYAPQALVGKTVFDLGISKAQWRSLIKDKKSAKQSLQITDAHGHPVPVQVCVKALGEFPFFTLMLEESAQVQHLQEDKEFLAAVLDSYTGAVTVQELSGKCVYWSEKASLLFGRNAQEAQGKMIYQLLPKKLVSSLHWLDEEVGAGKPQEEPMRLVYQSDKKTTKVLAVTKTLLPGPDLQRQFIVTIYEEVTKRDAREQDLQRSQKLLQAILENIPLGLYTRDCDDKITYVNPQSMRILNEQNVYNADHPNAFQQPHQLQEYKDREQQILKEGKTYEYPEEMYTDAFGHQKIVHVIKVPLLDAGPKPLVLTIVEDVTKRREQEREIERVNAFLTAIVQNAPIALYARAENGRILLRNKQCMQVFGHIFGPVDENGLDDNVGGVMLEEDEGNNKAFYHDREWEVLNSGKTLDIPEEEYWTPSGNKKLLHLIKTPVQGSTPDERCVITLVEDITSKKEQERALVESKNFLQTVIDQLPVSLSVKNYEGEYILWNKKSEELFGISAPEVIGQRFYQKGINKDQAQFMRENDLRVFDSKREQNIAQELISSASEGIKIMHTVKTPVFNSDGSPNCLLVVSEDITTKTKMEKQIREANDKNTLLVENAREGVVIVEDEKIIYANHAFCSVLGFEGLEELKNKSLLDLASKDHRPFLKEKYENIRTGADTSTQGVDIRFIRKDGTPVETQFAAVSAKYLGRRIVLGFVSDVTAANRTLREVKKERDNFLRAFESSPIPQFILSVRGYITVMNEAARRLFGFDPADKKFYTNVYLRPSIPLAVRQRMKNGLTAQAEVSFDFDRAARKFPGRIHVSGTWPLVASFTPLSKRDTKDGSVEAEYLVSLQPQTPMPAQPVFAPAAGSADSHGGGEILILPESEPYALCDEDLTITSCNELLCALCELRPEELKGQDIRRIFLQDEAPLLEQDLRLLYKEGQLSNREYTIRLASGLETCKVRLSARRGGDGTFLFTLRSLAFHLQVMKILEERSAQLSALRSAVNGAVLRVTFTDGKLGKIEQFNRWLSVKTGYSHEELAQYGLGDLFFDPDKEDQSSAAALMKAENLLELQGRATLVLPVRRKDGSSFWTRTELCPIDIPGQEYVLAVMQETNPEAEKISSQQQTAGRQWHALYRLSQETEITLTEQMNRLLSLGKEIFHADAGLVLRFSTLTGQPASVVQYVTENELHLERHMEFALESCLSAVLSGQTVLWPDTASLPCTHCIHAALQLGMLVAAPLVLDGKVAGALCFVARRPQHHFGPGAEEMLGLMARLAGLRIELRQASKTIGATSDVLSQTLEDVTVPALRLDTSLRITSANEPLLYLTGLRSDNLIGRDLFEQLVRSTAKSKRALKSALKETAEGEATDVKLEIRLPLGIYQEMTWHTFVCKNSSGQPESYLLWAQSTR